VDSDINNGMSTNAQGNAAEWTRRALRRAIIFNIGERTLTVCTEDLRSTLGESSVVEVNADSVIDEIARLHEVILDTRAEVERLKAELAWTRPDARLNETTKKSTADCYKSLIDEWIMAGKKMAMSKHSAVNAATCRRIIESLEKAGMHDAASWALWMLWWRIGEWQLQVHIRDYHKGELEQLRAEAERLRRELDKLPKTADGVPVYFAMIVYFLDRERTVRKHAVKWIVSDQEGPFVGWFGDDGEPDGRSPDDCYSTREAAEAAGETDK